MPGNFYEEAQCLPERCAGVAPGVNEKVNETRIYASANNR